MTKEQVQKHKEVIKWWLDNTDKGVWTKGENEGWTLQYYPTFSENFPYVQNDEYSEFRKALADGKQIQHLEPIISKTGTIPNSERWVNITLEPTFIHKIDTSKYRIKQDVNRWIPEDNELCIFWNDANLDIYIIGRFDRIHPIHKNKYQLIGYDAYCDNVAPLEYVQTLNE